MAAIINMLKNHFLNHSIIYGVVVGALVLAFISTSQFVSAQGIDYFDSLQFDRVRNILNGKAGNPWQYRILTAWINLFAVKVGYKLGLPYHIAYAFIFVRFLIDFGIYILAFFYYQRLGIYRNLAILGILLLAWGISYSWFNSDISTNTFLEVVFYLLAGLTILSMKWHWLPVIVFFAALNRETSGLIPFLFLAAVWFIYPKKMRNRGGWIFGISMVSFFLVFSGVRIYFNKQDLIIPEGQNLGMQLLLFNINREITWDRMLLTLSLIPIVSVLGYKKWPKLLKCFFWVMIPAWFLVHFFTAIIAETRLFIVPLTIVFIPGVLFYSMHPTKQDDKS